MKTYTNWSLFKEAAAIIKPKFWYVIAQFGTLFGVMVLVSSANTVGSILVAALISLLTTILVIGYARNGSYSLHQTFDGLTLRHYTYYFLASILSALAVFGGLVLLIIPGLMVLVRLMFVKYIAADTDVTPRGALRASNILTKGHRWQIFGFVLLALLVNILGVLCLVVGLLYTIPLTMIAMGRMYDKLLAEKNAPELPLVEATAAPIEVASA